MGISVVVVMPNIVVVFLTITNVRAEYGKACMPPTMSLKQPTRTMQSALPHFGGVIIIIIIIIITVCI